MDIFISGLNNRLNHVHQSTEAASWICTFSMESTETDWFNWKCAKTGDKVNIWPKGLTILRRTMKNQAYHTGEIERIWQKWPGNFRPHQCSRAKPYTRGHGYKLFKKRCGLDLRKNSRQKSM